MSQFIQKNFFNFFLTFLVVLNLLPYLAPIFAHFGLDFLSHGIYSIYWFSCHQFHWRSIHMYDHQMAWCARDTFIWLAFLTVTVFVKFRLIKKGIKWYWLVPFTIPIALDGGIQTIATLFGYPMDTQFYLSTNFIRMITGAIFGLGIGMLISPYVWEESYLPYWEQRKTPAEKSSYKDNALNYGMIGVIFILLFLFYILLVQIWNQTSPTYKPVGLLDHTIREAPPVSDWTSQRGLHGK